ncbi:glycosyl transferase [Cupriavidus sp. SK-4]|nr:glycosyl transferase [Cupriavidus sp. SK-4]
MRVAIVAPSPVPFIIGGAENLWWGMLRELNRRSGVVAELIKLPSPERNLIELIGSYRTFARLDLRHFDLVISTKYPAWMVRHPNHMVYLQHKLRGLYDTCPPHAARPPDAAQVAQLRLPSALEAALLEGHGGEGLDAAEVADILLAALSRPDTPQELLRFPGTFARAVVHLLDRIGMQPGHIRRYAAISRTVRDRAAHFPDSCAVEVFYHPTGLEGLMPATPPDGAGIFTASRLVPAKRIDLLIDAYVRSGVTLPLRIAGTGPEEGALRTRAEGHDGIRFLGRLTDAELAKEYAKAAFVPFVPYQEDYGLITLEAMLCGRPVLTVSDSGGPTELIEHGVNGVIAEPSAASLGMAIAGLATDTPGIKRMSAHALERASAIDWQAFGDWLLSPARPDGPQHVAPLVAPHVARPARPRIVVVNSFPVEPVVSGGKLRLFGLYRHLAHAFDVRFVNLADAGVPRHARPLAPGLVEEVVPVSPRLREHGQELEQKLGVSAGDLAAAMYPDSVPQWLEAVREQLRAAELAICAHPYGFPGLQAAGERRPHLYEAHNVEYDLKAGMYGQHAWAAQLVRHFERQCAEQARGVTACSELDAARLGELYELAETPLTVIPNGIEIAETPFVPLAERRVRARRFGKERPLGLFMGSAHGPNLDAALLVLAAAARSPALDFAIMGSVCSMLDTHALPGNVALLGVVGAAEKTLWLSLADYGLNPVRAGSGTNLKLAEYMASGLLVLSTEFGARGSGLRAWEEFVPIEADDLMGALRAARELGTSSHGALVASARAKVVATGDWRTIGARYAAFASGFLRT